MIVKVFLVLLNYMVAARSLSKSILFGGFRFTPLQHRLSFVSTETKYRCTTQNWNRTNHSALSMTASPEKAEELTVFHKIVRGELPCKKVYEDDLMLAFHDIEPVAPSHILLIPKKFDGLASLSDATERHEKVLGHMMVKAAQIAKENNLGDFRLVVNSGPEALQTVFYLHMHILAGRKFKWPPG